MNTHQIIYETLLCRYTNELEAINLLREYRPYFELIPSLRRPSDSVIGVPLPVIKLANPRNEQSRLQLMCDVALLMCDPEWKIKTGQEIFVFIHRPGEDFSDLLKRWRQVEVMLGDEYYWLLPWRYHQTLNDKGDRHYPLFVTLSYTPERIEQALSGAALPFVHLDVSEIEAYSVEIKEAASS
jgi:hypothetical protein